MIGVQCPRCSSRFTVEDDMRGRHDRCPNCATPVPIPSEPRSEISPLAHAGTVIKVPLSQADLHLQPDFEHYLAALANEVAQLRLFPATGPGADLLISVTLKPKGQASFTAMTQPIELMPDTAGLAELFRVLFSVRAPVASSVAEVTLLFAIRGGSLPENSKSETRNPK